MASIRTKILRCILPISLIIVNLTEALPRPQNDYQPNYATVLGAPLITPLQEDIILEVNSNYTLRCEANEPIVWIDFYFVKPEDQIKFDTLDPERPYGSMLYLNDLQAHSVGAYYCVKIESLKKSLDQIDDAYLIDLVNANVAATIYIYVNDPNNLLVPMQMPVGNAQQFQDFIVPCKPTVPSVEVLLTTSDDQVIGNSTAIQLSEGKSQTATFPSEYVYQRITYDPKFGFTVHTIDAFSYVNCFIMKDGGNETDMYTTFSSENTGRYNPQRGFVVQIRGFHETGIYTCRPKIPSPDNEEESTEIDVNFVGNEYINHLETSTTSAMLSITAHTITTTNNYNYNNNNGSTITTMRSFHNTNAIASSSTQNSNSLQRHDHRIHHNSKRHVPETFIDLTSFEGDGIDFGFGEQIPDDYNAPPTDSESSASSSSSVTSNSDGNNDDSDYDYDSENSSSSSSISTSIAVTSSSDALVAPQRSKKDVSSEERTTRRPSHRKLSSNNKYYDSSTPSSATRYIKKPQITSEQQHHAYVGDSFNLTCDVEIQPGVSILVTWMVPPGLDKSRYIDSPPLTYNRTMVYSARGMLTVKNAQLSDAGKYKCTVKDNSKNEAFSHYSMTILEPNTTYINMSEPSNHYNIAGKANSTINILANVIGFPIPTVTWHRPNGQKIDPTDKFEIESKETSTGLKIHRAHMLDSGTYVLNASNGENWKHLEFNVKVYDQPIVYMDDVYAHLDEERIISCRVLSSTPANVSFVFTACNVTPRWPACTSNMARIAATNRRPGNVSIETIYEYNFKLATPGIISCEAVNQETKNRKPVKAKAHIFISDINDNMTVYDNIPNDDKIARGDVVNITCVALAYYFTNDLEWYRNGDLVQESDDIVITPSSSKYSFSKSILFRSIQDAQQGSYECRAKHLNNSESYMSRYLNIFVNEPKAPSELRTNIASNIIKRNISDTLQLQCQADGIPKPTVAWYKDGEVLEPSDRLQFEDGNSTLIVPYMGPKDEGNYKCVVANRLGSLEANVDVQITDMPGITTGWVLAIIGVSIILFVLVIYLGIRVRQERKKMRELKAAGLANFEEGDVEQINQAMSLDEQAELLPYDRNFEFPRDKLKLGKQLGAGAFGVVLKAHAEGIKPDEQESVVAVKMVKRTADNEVMRALVSELKIMVHLGQHLNVVNLLGAVTKNIAKRELMVIVEYCRFGNVQNLLLKNRKCFIDQIHPETDKIDPTITIQRFSDNFELNRNSDNDPRAGTRGGRPGSAGYLRESDLYEGPVNSCATEKTVMTTIPEDDDNVMSNNSVQPAWRSNYKTDSTEAMTITTSDLVSWAFQVSRGMDYLSSRKVLHGDLAARNILLCENNVVKICDFGLARTMYKSDNYKKQGEAPLPIKWLALESLSDHVFSTYTDVWSFGIVLWEFFSLAKVPYPGMDANQSLFLKLKDGYRMEKPPFANDELYDIMLECWSTNAEKRPLFHVLEKRFARMLGDEVASHYMDLNDPYMRVNNEYMKRQQTDYLALMGSPDEMAPSPPKYVNAQLLPEITSLGIETSSDEYLQMSPHADISIFSPTRPKDYTNTSHSGDPHTNQPNSSTSFTFPPDIVAPPLPTQHSPTLVNNLDSPVNKNRKKELAQQPEEIPMLNNSQHYGSEDDSESPDTKRKLLQQLRSTPSPAPRQATAPIAETEFTNEYVNVVDPKKNINNNNSAGRVPDAFSNPGYQMLKTVTDDRAK